MPLHVKLVKLNIFRKFKSSWLNRPIGNLNGFFLLEDWLAAGLVRSSATYSAGVLPIEELTPNNQKKININNYSNNHDDDDDDDNNNNESDDGNNDYQINNNSNIIKIRYSLSVWLVLYLQYRDIHIW